MGNVRHDADLCVFVVLQGGGTYGRVINVELVNCSHLRTSAS